MCFSATASFTAGALMAGIGILTIKAAREPSELPFAAIPLLFAIQQLIEGVIWLTFRYETPLLNEVMTQLYSFFSHVLWPIYVPFAVVLIEPPGWRRRVLLAFVMIGLTVGVYFAYVLTVYQVVSRSTDHHIEYDSPYFFAAMTISLYLLSTTVSLFLSTYRTVNVFGVLVLLSFAIAYYFYETWFISVWCIFAGLLSVIVYLHFTPRIIFRKNTS